MNGAAKRLRPWLAGMCLAIAGTALAGEFTEGGAALWSQRVEGFVRAIKDRPEGVTAQDALGRACDGISGEMFKYGMYKTQVPNHASDALRRFCRGIDALNGKRHGRDKECNELRDARKQFAKIERDQAPARVTELAGYMVQLLDAMLAQGEQADWRGC